MTPQELKTLIESDSAALAAFTAGADADCAIRCMSIATPATIETRLSRLGILSLYANPSVGYSVLATIDAVAASNPVVGVIRSFMGPEVHPECLPDWGLASIRAALTAPTESGGLGLTSDQAGPILRAAEVPQQITTGEIEAARAI
jgi:hypothetical protein